MPVETKKVLGQVALSATTLTSVYTVTSGAQAVISSIAVANRSAASTTFRISVAVAGAADDPKQYLYYDIPINGNTTFVATLGLTLGSTDVVRAYAGNANLSVSVFGVEVQ